MDSVAIVVLNWNGLDDTRHAIESLARQDHQPFTIILIDNASTEVGTSDALANFQKTFGNKLQVITNNENLGFAGGVNVGIRYAIENKFTYVALFNNDAVAEKNWLSELVACAREQGSEITTGLLLTGDGNFIDSTGDFYTTWGLPFPRSRDLKRADAPASGPVFGATGGAALYQSSLFEDIGLFDEDYFAYYEDVDLSFRAQLNNHLVYYTDKAVAYHQRGATSSKLRGFSTKQTFKNLPMLFIKNVPRGLILKILPRFFLAYHLMLLKALLSNNFIAALNGWLSGIVLTVVKLPIRWRIQRTRKASSADISERIYDGLPPDQTGLRKLFYR